MNLSSIIILLVSLVIILIACDIFTNSIEWLGEALNVSEGVIGSIFAAVGTALPETLVPIIAVISTQAINPVLPGTETTGTVVKLTENVGKEVGMGAILGAPFMLGTLAMGVTGLAVLIYAHRKGRSRILRVDRHILFRDISFFAGAYTVAILAGFLPVAFYPLKVILALALLSFYGFYVYKHATDKLEKDNDPNSLNPLHFARHNPKPGFAIISFQVFVGLAGIVGAAYAFTGAVEDVARGLGFSPLILALVIAPIATELPEKINSVNWVRQGKDTLAMGNITGAMVFQSCIPVAFGLAFTSWNIPLDHFNFEIVNAFASAPILIISLAVIFLLMRAKNRLSALSLLWGGGCYLAYISYVVITQFN